MRYFEDFQPGQIFDLGSVTLTEGEIVEFAARYDPQPFHLSAERAKESPFGGIIASGMQTLAALMRLFVDGILNDSISLASPGIDEVRWRLPVRPGETLHGRSTVATCTPSRSRPEMGVVTFRHELMNEAGEVAMSLSSTQFLGRRPTG
jgi:acyl dehydratase